MGCSPGDNECFPDEKPPQRVSIDRGFWISQTEVTQAAYRRVTGQDPSFFKGGSLPVESITWDQARSYCRSVDMRLPTEEEWEYAARAGSTLSRYQDLDPFNAYDFLHSHEVAKPRPNAWGLYDTLGNVAEWTENGSGASGSKVVRGGSFGNTPEYVRVSARMSYPPAYSSNSLGVRCAGE
jgi:formylglycine-generating enzyme required for sulfatase activity